MYSISGCVSIQIEDFPAKKSDAGIGQLILGGAKHCNLKT